MIGADYLVFGDTRDELAPVGLRRASLVFVVEQRMTIEVEQIMRLADERSPLLRRLRRVEDWAGRASSVSSKGRIMRELSKLRDSILKPARAAWP
ncbi:hypothetical protein AS156_31150 [Bradyrhizobium macuxiense]|uniref:Uncharacterized protein n=1 Tax=Bradyrhizobium macuxiense TaxID=1755647 RepID=A0A109K2H4_9BRAD|nr:hypothetical protein AS156_31150 [Bradyrhizobium macuxiense]